MPGAYCGCGKSRRSVQMGLFQKWKDKLPKEKTPEELEKHYQEMDKLGKKDFLAMVIAALITYVPVAILIMVLVYGLLYILVLL